MKVDENLGKEIKAYDEGQHVILAPIWSEEPKHNDLVEKIVVAVLVNRFAFSLILYIFKMMTLVYPS